MSEKRHQAGKIDKLWLFLVQLHAKRPEVFESADSLRRQVVLPWPALNDPERCPNCDAGMRSQIRKVDYHIVKLVQAMGRIVRARLRAGTSFTAANKVHVNAHEDIPHNARNMTGIASDLGLIAPCDDLSAHWAITTRGWSALRGERVPYCVEVFRRKIIWRSDETITFREAIMRSDASAAAAVGYSEREWHEFGATQQGALL